jgi:hypothetical protein
MTTFPLLATATTVLSSGAGTASIGPVSPRESWSVSTVGVQCSTNDNESICSIYVGPSGTTSYLLGNTNWGSTGDSDTGITQVLTVGQQITAVWSGGDSGATAYLSVIGTKTIP